MSFKSVKFKDTKINIIDGDRGKNYPSQNEYLEDGYCLFLNAKNVTDSGFKFNKTKFITKEKDDILRKGKLEKEDVVLTTRGTVGNVGFFKNGIPYKNIRINSGMLIFRLENHEEFLPEYIYWYFRSDLFQNQIKQYVSGSAQPQLPVKTINEMEILKPDIEVQKKIVKIVSSINKKVLNNNRMNKTLEEIGQAIYKNWFVDFEPFQDEEFVDSEFGLIPKGWEIKKLDKLFNFKRGIEPGSKNYEENKQKNNVKFIRVGDVGEGSRETVFIDKKFIKKEKYCNYGDVLVSFDATIGRVTMIQEGCYNSGLKRIYPKKEYKDLFSNGLIYLMMKSDNIQNTINKYAAGTTILHASKSVKHLQHPFPKNDDILINFQKKIKPIIKKILLNKKENKSLKQLRDSLLPKLMSGEIRVPLDEDAKEVN